MTEFKRNTVKNCKNIKPQKHYAEIVLRFDLNPQKHGNFRLRQNLPKWHCPEFPSCAQVPAVIQEKQGMRQEGRRPWGRGGPCENWATVEGSGHQFNEKSHGWEQAHQQQFSCSAEQHFTIFYINKARDFLCLFRWNSQLSWDKLVFICFRRGPIETLGFFPSWNTWRKTSGFNPKKALSKKYVKQTWHWIINIPKIHSMWGKNKTGKENVFSAVK